MRIRFEIRQQQILIILEHQLVINLLEVLRIIGEGGIHKAVYHLLDVGVLIVFPPYIIGVFMLDKGYIICT